MLESQTSSLLLLEQALYQVSHLLGPKYGPTYGSRRTLVVLTGESQVPDCTRHMLEPLVMDAVSRLDELDLVGQGQSSSFSSLTCNS